MTLPVYIKNSACLTAVGKGISSLVEAIGCNEKNLKVFYIKNTFESHSDDRTNDSLVNNHSYRGFCLPEYNWRKEGIDRSILRSSAVQTRWLLLAAKEMSEYLAMQPLDSSDIGLFLGLPTVYHGDDIDQDDFYTSIPSDTQQYYKKLLVEAHPLLALVLLNSTACSHIAKSLGLMGDSCAYSHCADSGLNAFIEAYLSVAEDHNKVAVVGAVSEKINPIQFAQAELLDVYNRSPNWFPGEAAAFIALSGESDSALKVRIAGYSRGFVQSEKDKILCLQRCLNSLPVTLKSESQKNIWLIHVSGYGNDALSDEYAWQQKALSQLDISEVTLCSFEGLLGDTGPASSIVSTMVATDGLQNGYQIKQCEKDKNYEKIEKPASAAVVCVVGYQGTMTCIILTQENRRG